MPPDPPVNRPVNPPAAPAASAPGLDRGQPSDADSIAAVRAHAAASPPDQGAMPPDPDRVQKIALSVLVGLSAMYTLYFTQDILLPIFLAFLFSLLLRMPVKALRRIGVPEPAGAAIVMLVMVVLIGVGASRVATPAIEWLERAPTMMVELRAKLRDVEEGLADAREATERIQRMAAADGQTTPEVVVRGPNLADAILSQTQILLAQSLIIVALTFFFLAFGRRTLESVLRSLPDLGDRLHLADIVNTVQINISAYLGTITLINLALGVVTATILWALGMPNPMLFGIIAGLLNFIPYLGSAGTVVILALVSLLSFEEWPRILAPPLAFLLLTTLEGNFVTPTVVGRRLTLNPIFVFATVLFWGWLWGVPGALLAVPILAVFKILC
ncbi:MAG: hypothetical protein RLY86_2832, partial [Pseudomonadota bacterium]